MTDITLHAPRTIDGEGRLHAGRPISISAGRIRADEPDRRAERIDLDDCTILPGLIDAHTHLGLIAVGDQYDDKVPAAVLAAKIFENASNALMAGFTTVRDTGGVDGGLARAIDEGLVTGPRLFPSGPVICQSGGHGDFSMPFHPHDHVGVPGLAQTSIVADGPDEVRRAARTVLRRGATQVKVCVSGGVVSLSDAIDDTQFTVEELRAAVLEAQARHTYVTAHAHVTAGIRNGLEAGIECFEHGTYLDEETVSAMAAAGVDLVPTLAIAQIMVEKWREMGLPEEVVPRMDGVLDGMKRSLKMAFDAGIPIGSGSDIFGPTQGGFGRELSLKASVLSPAEAIRSAASVNAKILRVPGQIGTLEAGAHGDVIAVRGNPLDDPELFDDPANVVLVIKGGAIVKDLR